MNIKKILPSLLTFANLSIGFIVLLLISNGEYRHALSLIIIAMVLDGLDGKLARKLQVSGDFGKELDSLCDIASFGLVPAFYTWHMNEAGLFYEIIMVLALIFFIICGAYRLARFNVETSTKGFAGLPITIAGGLLALVSYYAVMLNTLILIIFTIFLALLMISDISYSSFKGSHIQFRSYWWYLIPVLITFLFILLPYTFLIVLIVYLFSGIANEIL
ncbi:CDP-diacylglycerol--serine O-phosphatidyltransferase [Natranaerobius trueperi]|uniref:CDP-diacylglycerol--serine O-phosphatidyltransferase n=1 Tax=Natranaerobius trueperi TaxID=759412 RepID=UPI001303EC80|nr:CDP-diacylglycerol--serine O-phosphatidyltransferase [Natranaerobius trueperi]